MPVTITNPSTLSPPLGQYSHVSVSTVGRLVHVAGMLAVDASGTIVGENDLEAQMRAVYANVGAALASVGAGFADIVQFTTYLVRASDIDTFMRVRLALFPELFGKRPYPPNTLLIVSRLVRPEFLVEVQTVAALA